jgi:hypothetical protein
MTTEAAQDSKSSSAANIGIYVGPVIAAVVVIAIVVIVTLVVLSRKGKLKCMRPQNNGHPAMPPVGKSGELEMRLNAFGSEVDVARESVDKHLEDHIYNIVSEETVENYDVISDVNLHTGLSKTSSVNQRDYANLRVSQRNPYDAYGERSPPNPYISMGQQSPGIPSTSSGPRPLPNPYANLDGGSAEKPYAGRGASKLGPESRIDIPLPSEDDSDYLQLIQGV